MENKKSRGAKKLKMEEGFAVAEMYQKALQNKSFLATEKIVKFTFWAKGQNAL